jgi:hypothetical protein
VIETGDSTRERVRPRACIEKLAYKHRSVRQARRLADRDAARVNDLDMGGRPTRANSAGISISVLALKTQMRRRKRGVFRSVSSLVKDLAGSLEDFGVGGPGSQ